MFRRSQQLRFWHTNATLVLFCAFLSAGLCGCSRSPRSADNPNRLVDESQQALESSSTGKVTDAKSDSVIEQSRIEQGKTPTAQAESKEPKQTPIRLFLEELHVKNGAEDHPEFTKDQLHKNFTLLMLALEPDIRAREMMRHLTNVFTKDQVDRAMDQLLAEDHQFQKLKRRRAEILENAYDGQNVVQALNQIEKETVEVSRSLRAKISKLLTPEQARALAAKRKLKEKSGDAERKAAKPDVTNKPDKRAGWVPVSIFPTSKYRI